MKKNAIYTIMLGYNPAFAVAYKTFSQYAKKVNADLIVCNRKRYHIGKQNLFSDSKAAWLEILYAKELIKKYERVLYIDADILITPHCPNIFELLPDLETNYLFNEGAYLDCSNYIDKAKQFFDYSGNWPTGNNRSVYFNTGVVLTSKKAQLFDLANLNELQNCYSHLPLYQQTYLNYLIAKHNLKHQSLPIEFNRMDYLGEESKRFEANFIHYADKGYSKKRKLRNHQIVADYELLYNPKAGRIKTLIRLINYKLQFFVFELMRIYRRNIARPLHNPIQYLKAKLTNEPIK